MRAVCDFACLISFAHVVCSKHYSPAFITGTASLISCPLSSHISVFTLYSRDISEQCLITSVFSITTHLLLHDHNVIKRVTAMLYTECCYADGHISHVALVRML
jgi:hypothetical protein